MKTLHTIYTSFAKRTAIILTLLLTLGVTSAWGANVTFQRITSTSELTSGAKYLIVYESGKLIFNGSSVATGANGETTTVTISNNTITCDEAYAFTITSSSSSWKITGSNGKSIGHTGSSNSLTTGSYTNTISFSSNNVVIGCNSRTLRCNPNNGSPLFRYYTSGQQAIQLYKQTAPSTFTVTYTANGASGTVPTDANEYASGATVTAKSHGNLVKEGFSFAGWKRSDNSSIVQENTTFTMPASNLTLTAQWAEKALTNYRTTCTTETSRCLTPKDGGDSGGTWRVVIEWYPKWQATCGGKPKIDFSSYQYVKDLLVF